jgi:DNA-binding IclR family transcriptional regulator
VPQPTLVPPAEANSASTSSAERSLRLLAKLADDGRAMSLAELGAALALPKATVHRICTQLLQAGYVARDLAEREYVVGPALRKLALDTLNHGTVRGLRHEVLSSLVAEVGETCNFTTLDGAEVLYLDRVEAPWPWRLTLDVGAHVPLHCTASGKLFLAFMPARPRAALIGGLTLQAMTQRTITDAAQLEAECRTIAAQGYAFDREEFIDGLVAAAVPVHDAQQRVVAAVAVHAPTTRLTLDGAVAAVPALRAAAEKLGHLL